MSKDDFRAVVAIVLFFLMLGACDVMMTYKEHLESIPELSE